jgi:hypothetical protein
MRDSVEEIGRAIERIDDEAGFAFCSGNLATLFHQETPIRAGDFKFAENRIFGAFVGLRYEICRPLLANLQMLNLAKVTAQLPTRFTGGLFHDGQ